MGNVADFWMFVLMETMAVVLVVGIVVFAMIAPILFPKDKNEKPDPENHEDNT